MKTLRVWLARLAGLFSGDRRDSDLREEIEANLQMHIDENLRAGMGLEEARRNAIWKLGGVEPTREAYRDARTVPILEHVAQDVRFALRQCRKNPGFTATAVFILAVGMCASVAIFAFVDAALLKPLPYRQPGRLVAVFESIPLFHYANLSYLDYLDWKKMNKSFSSLEVYHHTGMMISTPEGAKAARGSRVSAGFFRALGVAPALGRDFRTGEDLPAGPRTLLLSYAAWQQKFGARADVLGQTVTINSLPHTIIGVLPKEFHFAPAEPAEFWLPIEATGECAERRSCHNLYGLARLKDGVTIETALADIQVIARQLEKQYPGSNRDQGASLKKLAEEISGGIRPILLALMGGAALLLIIATVNVASLLLVRSESRRREMSVRSALGASSGRLASQFAIEGTVLVAAGGGWGVLASSWAMQLLTKLIPEGVLSGMPYLRNLGFNVRVAGFAAAVGIAAVLVFALTPAIHFSLSKMREGIAEGARGSSGRGWGRLGSKLVVLELAAAMVLLVGAGLLAQSLDRLLHVQIGIETGHLLTMEIAAPRSYDTDEKALALEQRIVQAIRDLPAVKTVGVGSDLPVSHWGNTTWVRVLGRPWHGEHLEMPERDVSAAYFQALGARLQRGRFFEESEDASKPHVAIINQAFAKEYFPGEDPLGKQLSYLTEKPVPIEIVGILEDVKEGALDTDNKSVLYLPFNQNPGNYFNAVVRTSQAEAPLIPLLTAAIRGIDPNIVTSEGQTMTDRVEHSYSAYMHRSAAFLVGGFAGLALLLGVVGLYGVVAYSVSQRTREIGVRMALGADPGAVYRLVLRDALWLTSAGVLIGAACSVGGAMLIRGLLFGIKSWDIPTFIAVAILLSCASLAASFLPARRAASVNPVDALRAE